MDGEKNDVPVVAWRIVGVNITDEPERASVWRKLFAHDNNRPLEPLVRQSDHLGAVERLTRERDEARESARRSANKSLADVGYRNKEYYRALDAESKLEGVEAEVEKLREALRPFAEYKVISVCLVENRYIINLAGKESRQPRLSDFYGARAALSERDHDK